MEYYPIPKGYYYISVGEKSCLYTLRQIFYELDCDYVENGRPINPRIKERDWHIKNLSKDKEAAIKKATEYLGYKPKIGDREVKQTIKRNKLDWSKLRFGKYRGKTIEEINAIDPDYLKWVAVNFNSDQYEKNIKTIKEFLGDSIKNYFSDYEIDLMVKIAQAKQYAFLNHLDSKASNHIGQIGQRLQLNLSCIKIIDIHTTDYWGRPAHADLILFIDDQGNHYKWFTSTYPEIEQGDKISAKATIKAHDEYKGVRQTALSRLKVI